MLTLIKAAVAMLRRVGLAVEGGRGPIGVAQAGISAVGISANVECDERRRTNVSRPAGAEAIGRFCLCSSDSRQVALRPSRTFRSKTQ